MTLLHPNNLFLEGASSLFITSERQLKTVALVLQVLMAENHKMLA